MNNHLRNYTRRRLEKRFSVGALFRRFSVTTWIVILNILFFLISSLLFVYYPESLNYLALTPILFFGAGYVWTLLTSMFMHANLFHIFVNMFSLVFVGNLVERIIGRKRYLWFYLIAGLIAGLVFVVLSYFFGGTLIGARIFGSSDIAAVGASGAIFGLVGLLAVLIPYNKVYLIGGPLIAIVVQAAVNAIFPTSSFLGIFDTIITIYIFFSIFAMLSFSPSFIKFAVPIKLPFWLLPIIAIVPLVIIGLFVQLPIANTAHFGGLLVGIFYGYYLKHKYKRKTELISRMFSSR